MPVKMPGFSMAVGYWGRDPLCRVLTDQTGAKERVLLQDQLRTNGRPVDLWQPVLGTTPGIVPCTCAKDTTLNSDVKCLSCYGSKRVPGFLRFMHETLFFASAESTSFILTGCVLDTSKKPNRLMLASGVALGTIETQDKPYTNLTNTPWTVELNLFQKILGDGAVLERSLDSGASWATVPLVVAPAGQFGFRADLTGLLMPVGAGTLRFRITLSRASGNSAESPSFEILRARHPQPERLNTSLSASPRNLLSGQILVLKTWEVESVLREVARGRQVEHTGDRVTTAPLDFFDVSLTHDTPPVALDDRDSGPHPFFEYSSGVRNNQRYAVENVSIDSTVGNIMTHQSWNERRTQEGEMYGMVF